MSRLEEIESVTQLPPFAVSEDGKSIITEEAYQWLIRQAERVEESERRYEKAVDESEIFQREHLQARKRARKYKQALEEVLTTNDWESIQDYLNRIRRAASEALKGDTND